MQITEDQAILGLSRIPNFGYKHYLKAVQVFGSARDAINSDILQWHKIFPKIKRDIVIEEKEKYICITDSRYPEYLREINYPPLVLYYRGNIDILRGNLISIVGTRSYTSYGERVTTDLIEKLSRHNYVFVSGMAKGIDTIVHKTALNQGASTVAILPSNLSNPQPMSNYRLFNEISEDGLVLTEYHENTKWNRHLYAQRNRIIAGLSMSTIVTEAPIKSGSLITANLAFEFNREVLAVPGNIYARNSAGTNWLIKNSKANLLDLDKMLINLNQPWKKSNKESDRIIDLLESNPLSFEDLQGYVSIPPHKLRKLILCLELDKQICLNSVGKYTIV